MTCPGSFTELGEVSDPHLQAVSGEPAAHGRQVGDCLLATADSGKLQRLVCVGFGCLAASHHGVGVGLIQNGKPLRAQDPPTTSLQSAWAPNLGLLRSQGHPRRCSSSYIPSNGIRGNLALRAAGLSSRGLPCGSTSDLRVPGQFKRRVF